MNNETKRMLDAMPVNLKWLSELAGWDVGYSPEAWEIASYSYNYGYIRGKHDGRQGKRKTGQGAGTPQTAGQFINHQLDSNTEWIQKQTLNSREASLVKHFIIGLREGEALKNVQDIRNRRDAR